MNVLSLFDGMSCGQIALMQLGIIPKRYYASEIDKYAIKQTQLNFPATIQLGDVEKWREWDINWKSIDLLLAGSPCQGFSFAGKQLAFDDPRSKLFFVFVDILNHIRNLNPDLKFLLENVNMKKDYLRIISEHVGVYPVRINSNLVSAQNRDRWYWTNIRTRKEGLFSQIHSYIPQPEDRGIILKDILECNVDKKYYVSEAVINRMLRKNYSSIPKINPEKTGCLNTKNNSGQMSLDSGNTFIKLDINGGTKNNQLKASCFTAGANSGGNHSDMDLIYFNTTESNSIFEKDKIRRLTPTECSRLQTIPGWYKWDCSDTQIYRMLGNGWTVEVIVHILSFWDRIRINFKTA